MQKNAHLNKFSTNSTFRARMTHLKGPDDKINTTSELLVFKLTYKNFSASFRRNYFELCQKRGGWGKKPFSLISISEVRWAADMGKYMENRFF